MYITHYDTRIENSTSVTNEIVVGIILGLGLIIAIICVVCRLRWEKMERFDRQDPNNNIFGDHTSSDEEKPAVSTDMIKLDISQDRDTD
jgi:hypothetical protein